MARSWLRFAGASDSYIAGLVQVRGDGVEKWIAHVAAATVKVARLALIYIEDVHALQ